MHSKWQQQKSEKQLEYLVQTERTHHAQIKIIRTISATELQLVKRMNIWWHNLMSSFLFEWNIELGVGLLDS